MFNFGSKPKAGYLPDGRKIPIGKKICPQCEGNGEKGFFGKCSKCWGEGVVSA